MGSRPRCRFQIQSSLPFKDAGAEIVLASPAGGQPPLDPKSDLPDFQTEMTHRFKADPDAQQALAQTVKLGSVKEADFDTVFYPGGHGPMWDLADSKDSIALIEAFERAG
jgi:putative intracellular protease/amidase